MNKDFLKAMNHIDDALIEEAKPKDFQPSEKEPEPDISISKRMSPIHSRKWILYISAVCCSCLLLVCIQYITRISPKINSSVGSHTDYPISGFNKYPGNAEIQDITQNESAAFPTTSLTEMRTEDVLDGSPPTVSPHHLESEEPMEMETGEIETWLELESGSEICSEPFIPDTDILTEANGFHYYCYNQDGTYTLFTEDYEESNKMTLLDVATAFLKANHLSDTTVSDTKVIVSKSETTEENGVATHRPATNTFEIYLMGEVPNEPYLIGLINTIFSYNQIKDDRVGMEYVKLYGNGTLISLSETMPEPGYTSFEVPLN